MCCKCSGSSLPSLWSATTPSSSQGMSSVGMYGGKVRYCTQTGTCPGTRYLVQVTVYLDCPIQAWLEGKGIGGRVVTSVPT